MYYLCIYFQVIVMLCIFDSLFAGFSLIEYGLKKGFKLILWTTPIYVDIWPRLIYPFHNIANTLSVFVTVAIAIERWVIFIEYLSLLRISRDLVNGIVQKHANNIFSSIFFVEFIGISSFSISAWTSNWGRRPSFTANGGAKRR